ncbi:MAG: hypothetical protein ACOCRK_01610 [bacterium]
MIFTLKGGVFIKKADNLKQKYFDKRLKSIEKLAGEISNNDKADIVISLQAETIKEEVQGLKKMFYKKKG